MPSRRAFIRTAAGVVAALSNKGLIPNVLARPTTEAYLGPQNLPRGALDSATLDALPGKRALIKRTFRPPNYETPINDFQTVFTPNDRFFVRYHHAVIPKLRASDWSLRLGGDGAGKVLSYTLEELQKRFTMVEVPALCFCAGNRRGLFEPHVPGIQWGYGAMGNATWRGVRLRDLLRELRIKKDAIEVTFDGAESGVFAKTPDFVKSLPLWKAMDENTLIAFAMNGEPLPHWNGYPARLVVPGWAATYWVKHLTTINVVTKAFDGYWMKTAYRLPLGLFISTDRFASQESAVATPITELVVNSLITGPTEGQEFKAHRAIEIAGLAWDGGSGIERVEYSTDGGQHWRLATLGQNYGNFAWRPWSTSFVPKRPGSNIIMVRATNRRGNTQASTLIANPAGYHHNVIQRLTVQVV